MNIDCPHCDTTNRVEFAENIHCHKCNKSFAGFSYRKYKTSFIASGAILLVGAWGGQKIDREYFEAQRYPSAAIYEIISFCSTSQRASINRSTQTQLIKKCSCALDKTMPEVNQKHLNIKSMKFLESFGKNLNSCK